MEGTPESTKKLLLTTLGAGLDGASNEKDFKFYVAEQH